MPCIPAIMELARASKSTTAVLTRCVGSCKKTMTGLTDIIAAQTLYPNNYQETVKEWTGVFGFDYQSPDTTEENTPKSGYTRETWGVSDANPLGTVQGIYALNVGHTVPING